jgi:protein TonB
MPGLPFSIGELKRNHQRYFAVALVVAAIIHLSLLGGYYGFNYFSSRDDSPPTQVVRIIKYSEMGAPPSIAPNVVPAVSIAGPATKPTVGVPVPVPDAEVKSDQIFASQAEMNAVAPTEVASVGTAEIQVDLQVDEPPPAFVPFEKEPTCIKRVEPIYPEIAQKAGLEGSVYAKLWITKDGKIKDVVIMKSDSEIFNQAVIDAARQWLFTPAMMKNGPVAVWLAVPFNFTLK